MRIARQGLRLLLILAVNGTAAADDLTTIFDGMRTRWDELSGLSFELEKRSVTREPNRPASVQKFEVRVDKELGDDGRIAVRSRLYKTEGTDLSTLTFKQDGTSIWNGSRYFSFTEEVEFGLRIGSTSTDSSRGGRIHKNYLGRELFDNIFFGDSDPLWEILTGAENPPSLKSREEIDGYECQVIEGDTEHGTYRAWIDTNHGFHPRKVIIEKDGEDIRHATRYKATRLSRHAI